MPIYEYECRNCGEKFELRRGITDSDSEIKCPKCGYINTWFTEKGIFERNIKCKKYYVDNDGNYQPLE